MNRKEAERLARQQDTLVSLGFTRDEAESLRRISMTLRRWHEMECGTGHGCIERDEKTGRTYWLSAATGKRYRTPDRETGARKRLAAILKRRNGEDWEDCGCCGGTHPKNFSGDCRDDANRGPREPLQAYIQTDPRGAALYILRQGDVPEGADVSSYYSRGVCVY